MRFEGKHRVFKKIIHDTNNFKNVLKTCAERHQMMTFLLSSPRFLRPPVQTSKIHSVFIDSLPSDVHASISKFTKDLNVLSAKEVTIKGISLRLACMSALVSKMP